MSDSRVGADILLKMTTSDLELLREYAQKNCESSFAELVQRHLNLVYSAALRQVRSPQLAEEVAQSVFTDLVRNAPRLAPDTILTAWLYQVSHRTAIDVVRREARRQLREQIATEMNSLNATAADWTHIEPLLDEAMHALDDTDRAAVLLRYFENKSLREVGAALGTSDDAAQKRVTRAVERLREYFAQRGVTIGASGLVVVLSANAVQAAPVGLAVIISASTLAGTTLVTTSTATAAKAIAMTTLQKMLVTTVIIVTTGIGIYETRKASILRNPDQLPQQQAPLTEQFQQLTRERDDATKQLAALRAENDRLNRNASELLKLRVEVGMLRKQNQTLAQTEPAKPLDKGFGTLGEYISSEAVADVGNGTPEALLQTFLYAMREGNVRLMEKLGSGITGQRKPGDIEGEIPASTATYFKIVQTAITNSAGFRLSSKAANNEQAYEVHLVAEPLPDRHDEGLKDLNLSLYIERIGDLWAFGTKPSDGSTAPSK